VLAPEHTFQSWAATATAEEIFNSLKRDMLAMAEAALKSFGPVQARQVKPIEQLPYRGIGIKPDGAVDLAIYRRALHQGKSDGPSMRDTLSLSKEEWSAFAPSQPSVGHEWEIPDHVARKLVRPLVYNTFGDPHSLPAPEDAKIAQLTAKVETVDGGRARIRLTGTFEAIKLDKEYPSLSYRSTATADGIAVYDSSQQSMSSLLLVFRATYLQEEQPELKEGGRFFGAVIEWQQSR